MIEQLVQEIDQLSQEAVAAIQQAEESSQLEAIRIQYTGKKGALQAYTQKMKDLSNDDKPKLGKAISSFNQ